MNKMIKTLIVIVVLFVVLGLDIFVINGIKGQDTFKIVSEKMMIYENYKMIINTDVYYKANSTDIKKVYKINADVDAKNNKYFLMLDIDDSSHTIYGEKDADNYVTYEYLSKQNKWLKTENKYSIITAKQIGKMLNKATGIRLQKSELDGLKKYTAYVDMNYIMPFSITTSVDDVLKFNKYKFNKDVKAEIYINYDNELEFIKFDMTDYFKENNPNIKLGFYNFNMSISFSKYNKLGTVVIPSDVRDNLSVPIDYESEKNKITEEEIMYNVILASVAYCEDVTIDFTKYNHELDKYFVDKDYLSLISEGTVKINQSCQVDVLKDFIINNKKCVYKNSNNISCK